MFYKNKILLLFLGSNHGLDILVGLGEVYQMSVFSAPFQLPKYVCHFELLYVNYPAVYVPRRNKIHHEIWQHVGCEFPSTSLRDTPGTCPLVRPRYLPIPRYRLYTVCTYTGVRQWRRCSARAFTYIRLQRPTGRHPEFSRSSRVTVARFVTCVFFFCSERFYQNFIVL